MRVLHIEKYIDENPEADLTYLYISSSILSICSVLKCTVDVPNSRLFDYLFVRVLACATGRLGSIPGRDILVSGRSSRGWR
jgi:hypothetical protein